MISTINYITSCALKSLIYEVSASPKPGLVDRHGNGAHTDMDFFTFVDSTFSLQSTFFECANAGALFTGTDLRNLFNQIRPIGIIGEKNMFKATGGINTHKGAIFSLGILCAASAYILNHMEEKITARALGEITRQMTAGLTQELEKSTKNQTSGERLYKEKGVLGIRGEVEQGFPSVVNYGLPILESMLKRTDISKNDILVHVLIELLRHVEDTNVMSRYGEKGLKIVRERSADVLQKGGVTTSSGLQAIHDMDAEFVEKNISPGGTADLLAVTLMFHFLSGDGML